MGALRIGPADVAARLDEEGEPVTAHTVRGWMRGEYMPHNDRLAALARALDVGLTDVALAVAGIEPPGGAA